VKLERLVDALDEEWRSSAAFDAELARILRPGKFDTLAVPTARFSLDAFGVLEHDRDRVRKRPGFVVPEKTDFVEIENRRLREAQKREEEDHAARERNQAEQLDPVWQSQRAQIRGVVIATLRELRLLGPEGETLAGSAGERE
jgi:hypothetical protein